MTCGIYKITAPSGNSYIGSSCNIENRLSNHRSKLRHAKHENRRLQGAFRKYGKLKDEVLLVCRAEDLIMYEQICIDGLGPRYNQSRLADRSEWSKESRARLSATLKSRKFTPEHRAKIGAASKGRVPSAETRAKLSAAHIGKTISPAHRAKLSVAGAGRKLTPEHRSKLKAVNTGKKHSAESIAKMSRKVFSVEARRKISMAAKNRSIEHRAKLSRAAKNISAETREKMKCAAKNRSAEHRAKISANNKARAKIKRLQKIYDGGADFSASYWLACRFASLQLGSARFNTIPEMYWLESKGIIP